MPIPRKYATIEENQLLQNKLDKLEQSVSKLVDFVINKEQKVQPIVEEAKQSQQQAANAFFDSQFEKIFYQFFDRNDGFKAEMKTPQHDDKGRPTSGTTVTITVPDKFSNDIDAHKKVHPIDRRTKTLDPNDLVGSFTEWCKLVAQNLRYNIKERKILQS